MKTFVIFNESFQPDENSNLPQWSDSHSRKDAFFDNDSVEFNHTCSGKVRRFFECIIICVTGVPCYQGSTFLIESESYIESISFGVQLNVNITTHSTASPNLQVYPLLEFLYRFVRHKWICHIATSGAVQAIRPSRV